MKKKFINYGKHSINKADIKSIVKVFNSDFLTQGSEVIKFEKKLKKKFKSKYCTVVSSGTAALHLACRALEFKRNDIIFCSPLTFVSSVNSILFCGAKPYLIDINEVDYNLDINKLEENIKLCKKKKKNIKGIVVTDYAGHPADWGNISYLSKKYNLKTINDNCHSMGSKINNNIGYAVKYADIVTHSYHPVKAITTGEGGSLLTNIKKYDLISKKLRTHSIVRKENNIFDYDVDNLGYNYRITDFQCALGSEQIKRLNKFVKKKRGIASIYDKEFSKHPLITTPKIKKNYYHSYHLYPLRIDFELAKIKKENFINTLKKKGYNLQVHYKPIHFFKYHKDKVEFDRNKLKFSEIFFKQEISLPIFYELKNFQIYKLISLIKKLI